jgi:hypothetical protein
MRLGSTPILARGRDVRPLLLGGMKRLFLSVRPHAWRLTDERPTWMAPTANLMVQLIQCQIWTRAATTSRTKASCPSRA